MDPRRHPSSSMAQPGRSCGRFPVMSLPWAPCARREPRTTPAKAPWRFKYQIKKTPASLDRKLPAIVRTWRNDYDIGGPWANA